MLLLRLKTEWNENLKMVLVLWGLLGLTVWSVLSWWFAPFEIRNAGEALVGFSMLGVAIVVFFLVSTMFKRDDLKHPQDFLATRPIRSSTVFGAKLLFATITVVLPIGIAMSGCSLAVGLGWEAMGHGVEAMLWVTCFSLLVALSCMAFPGGGLSMVCLGLFVGGLILMAILFAYSTLLQMTDGRFLSRSRITWNVLLVIVGLIVLFGILNLWLIRQKHFRFPPVLLLIVGMLSAFFGTYAPIPGAIPSRQKELMDVEVLEVSRAFGPEQYSISYGNMDGARFVSQAFPLDLPDVGLDIQCMVEFSDLEVVGGNHSLESPEVNQVSQMVGPETPGQVVFKPLLSYTILEREPDQNSGRSSSSGGDGVRVFETLPKKSVRVKGWFQMKSPIYKKLHRAPLGETFSERGGGVMYGFIADPTDSRMERNSIFYKVYTAPLLTSSNDRYWDMIRQRVEHPVLDLPNNNLEGGGSGTGGPFGYVRTTELRLIDSEIRNSYKWSTLKEKHGIASVEQWKKEAELVLENVDHVKRYRIQVDVDIEVPDPDKVRELLAEGSFDF